MNTVSTQGCSKIRQLAIVLITLIVAGCSANGLIIRYLYGQLDDNLYERINAYAIFDDNQKILIRQAVDQYMQWHRSEELPRYVDFLIEATNAFQSGAIDQKEMLSYFDRVRSFSRQGFIKSPFSQSASFLKNMSDKQVAEVESYFVQADQKFEAWHDKRQQPGSEKARLKAIVKNIKRIGIKLDAGQQSLIAKGLTEYQGSAAVRHGVFQAWRNRLVVLLRQRQQADFENQVTAHIAVYQNLVKNNNPAQHAHNQRVSAKIITEVLASLDGRQRQKLIDRLRQTQTTLLKMSSN